jgi:hypothetical protein
MAGTPTLEDLKAKTDFRIQQYRDHSITWEEFIDCMSDIIALSLDANALTPRKETPNV